MSGRTKVVLGAVVALGVVAGAVLISGNEAPAPRAQATGAPSPTVSHGGGDARLAVFDRHVALAARVGYVDARIANSGGEALRWKAGPSERWLDVTPARGALEPGEIATLRISADRTRLNEGKHEARVALASDGGDNGIRVDVTVGSVPLLIVPSPTLEFGPQKEGSRTKTFAIRNGGKAPLSWSAESSKAYVVLPGPASGSLGPGEEAKVNATFDYTAAYFGRQAATITVTSDGGTGSITAVGEADRQSPGAKEFSATEKHLHCAGGQCERFRHAYATVTDDFSKITTVKVQYQVCGTSGPPGTNLVCTDRIDAPMKRLRGNRWVGEIGPLPECTKGYAAHVPWRVWTQDSSGNIGAYPGSSAFTSTRICDRVRGEV